MSNNIGILLNIDFQTLETEYPGIRQISTKFQSHHLILLGKISAFVKYNVPKDYYIPELKLFQEQLKQMSDAYIQALDRQLESSFLPQEIVRKLTPISDEEEAEVMRKQSQQQIIKPSLVEIQRFIHTFNAQDNLKFVSPEIIRTLHQLANSKRCMAVLQIVQVKQREKKNKFVKSNSSISKESYPKKEKPQIIITMGDKIPLQVRQMRNYVKQASLDSFAVVSQIEEEKKSELQKRKIQISLCLNQVALDNMNQLYDDLYEQIIQSKELAEFLIDELLKKCILQYKMIKTYLKFICKFIKINPRIIQWTLNDEEQNSYKNTINNFHKLFTTKLQSLFQQSLEDLTLLAQIKSIGYIIGTLVKNRKLSRKIYLQVNNSILCKILKQSKTGKIQQNQLYFEGLINMIQSLGNTYQQIWESDNVQQKLSKENKINLSKIMEINSSITFQQILINLNNLCKFPTARIRCLIQNLYERKLKEIQNEQLEQKQNSQNPQNNSQYQFQQKILRVKQILKQQNNIEQAIEYYYQGENNKILTQILLIIFDGSQAQVNKNVQTFIKYFNLQQDKFNEYWNKNFLHFVYQQCDLPFMTSGLAEIIFSIMGDKYKQTLMQVPKQSEDFQDVTHFMSKLAKKLSSFSSI